MQKKVEKKIKDISLRMNIPFEVVKSIFESQFSLARKVTKAADTDNLDTFKNIRFKYLGLLVARKPQIIKIQENIERISLKNE